MTEALNLTDDYLTVGAREVAEIVETWSTEKRVASQVDAWGFPPVERPNYTAPSISPEHLATLSHEAYTDLYARCVAWLNYAESNHAYVRNSLKSKRGALAKVKAAIIKQVLQQARDRHQKKPSKEVIDNIVGTHPSVQELELIIQQLEQQEIVQGGHFENLKRNAALISRSIEIRRVMWEDNRVHNNIPHRPAGPHYNPHGQQPVQHAGWQQP
jgi:hypothetical protein